MATRDENWEALKLITNALLDGGFVRQVDVKITQMGDQDQMFGFISLNVDLTQKRYDEVRAVVNGLGGAVIVTGTDDDPEHNLRIWPIAVAS